MIYEQHNCSKYSQIGKYRKRGCVMIENTKKIQNLLENVIRASRILMQKGYLNEEEGELRIRTLMGIRQRFLSDDYMRKTPKGFDIDEIDEMILPLDRMLVDAGKRGYRNTISYILKAVIQGAGVGHRMLTEEENKNRALTLLQRKLKMQDCIEEVKDAWKLDEKISSRKFTMKRQEMLYKDCKTYEVKIDKIKQTRPDIIEEVLYFTDVEDVSSEAFEYIELTSSLEKTKRSIQKNEDDLKHLEYIISSYMQGLEQAKHWDKSLDIQNAEYKTSLAKTEEKISVISSADTKTDIKTDIKTEENDVVKTLEEYDRIQKKFYVENEEESLQQEELTSEEKLLEMQKLIEKFVDEDGPNMIDLEYEAMERAFASPELKAYVAKSLQEFEELGLANED